MLKKTIKKIIGSLGYEIHLKPQKNLSIPTNKAFPDRMSAGLQRTQLWDIQPHTVFDVGAAAGTWTKNALKYWPNANYVLFELLSEREENLTQLKNSFPNTKINVLHKLVGEKSQTVAFNVSDDLDGRGVYAQDNAQAREVESVSIDETVQMLNCKAPYAIKLDTHGYEIPILKGAAQTLQQTELLIIEVYGFYVSPTAILFWELCQYLDQLGFRPIDIVDTMRRKTDEAFWQCDMFFIAKDSQLFQSNSYQ